MLNNLHLLRRKDINITANDKFLENALFLPFFNGFMHFKFLKLIPSLDREIALKRVIENFLLLN